MHLSTMHQGPTPIAAAEHPRRGFTLIELLVVIAIIALLISLLVPALGAAKSAARTMKCGTQLRSIGTAVYNYADDHKDFLPPVLIDAGVAGYPDGEVFSNIFCRLGYMSAPQGLAANSPFRCPEQMVDQNIGSVGWASASGPHRTQKHFMYTYPTAADPSGTNPQEIDGWTVPTWYHLAGGNHPNWSFQWIRSNGDWGKTHKLGELGESDRVLAAEQSNVNASGPGYGQGRIAARHGAFTADGDDGRCNMVFFDGHVEGVRTENWYSGLNIEPIRYLYID